MLTGLLDAMGRLIDPSSPAVYLIVFAGGLLSSFLPCSLSSLPLVITYVGSGRRDVRTGFLYSSVFAAGMAVTFTVLASAALALGSLIGATSRIWYLVLAILMLLMGLQMLGIISLVPASYLQTRNRKRGVLGALLAGILSGIFSSPCSTPVLVAVLSLASMSGSAAFSIALILCYAAGYSILSILAGTFVGLVSGLSSRPGYQRLSRIFELVLGLAILLLSFYLFYQAF